LDAFEEHLTVVLRSIAAAGGIPVLSTPPALLLPDDAPQGIDQLVYVEAVRSLAAEFDVPLVDHWEHWEQCAVPPGRAGSWFDKDGQSPSAIGLAQIAERLLAELNLSGGRSRKSKEVATGARPERQSQR
jgi:lysophospholipase L1-like esterase